MNWSTRAAVALFAVLSTVQPALANRGEDWKMCEGGDGISPNEQVEGCTAFLRREASLYAFFHHNASRYDLAWGFNIRGSAYSQQGQYDRAIKDLDAAIALVPENSNAFLIRGGVYSRLGQYARAIEDYDQAIKLKPDVALGYNNRCFTRAIQGQQLDAAMADCMKALRLQPRDASFLDSLGFVHFRMGDYATAIADYDSALAASPRLASSLHMRGLAKLKTGDLAGGNADIAAAAALDPKIADTYAGYGVKP
jgi:tetratricopeptide (TPR) repeat protein